jgi:hypothetical protein
LDWDKICPFLDIPIPENEPWPSRHEADEFKEGVDKVIIPAFQRATTRLALTVTGVVVAAAAAAWYL